VSDEIWIEPPVGKTSTKWTARFKDLSDRCNPDDATQLRRVAKNLGVELEKLRTAFLNARKTDVIPEEANPTTRLRVLKVDGEKEEDVAVPRAGVEAILLAAADAKRVRWDESVDAACALVLFKPGIEQDVARRVTADLAVATGAVAAFASRKSAELLFEGEDEIPATGRALASLLLCGVSDLPYVRGLKVRRSLRPQKWRARGRPAPLGAVLRSQEYGHADGLSINDPRVVSWLNYRAGNEGARLPHHMCVIAPSPYEGRDPVIVLEQGLWCFRCAGRLGEGWRPWSRIIGVPQQELELERDPWLCAADAWTHWEHGKITLALPAGWPKKIGHKSTGQVTFSAMLAARHPRIVAQGEFKKRAEGVFNESLRWVRRHDGRWVHSDTFESIELRDAEIACLPWVRSQRERIALARSTGPLEGYLKVRPIDVILNPKSEMPGVVTVARPGDGTPPPLSSSIKPLPYDEACRVLKRDYPGIREDYLLTLVVAMACAEAGGPPIILAVIGPTGSGKTQTVGIAASIVRSTPADVTEAFPKDEEYWRRRVGEAMSSGRRPLIVNDLHRVRGLHRHIKGVIGLEDPIEYRPLYSSAVRARCSSPLVLTFVRMPSALHAPEMARRLTYITIETSVHSDWRKTGPSPSAWRSTPKEREKSLDIPPNEWKRVRAAEGILAHALEIAKKADYVWPNAARVLGCRSGEETHSEQGKIDGALLALFYEHVCGRHEERVLSNSARWPGERGWVDLSSPVASKILEEFMPDVGGSIDPRHILTQDLQEIDWPKRLGIKSSAIRFEGQFRHRTWVGRFVGPGRLGERPVNEDLPDASG